MQTAFAHVVTSAAAVARAAAVAAVPGDILHKVN
jgi:hypothetical protein